MANKLLSKIKHRTGCFKLNLGGRLSLSYVCPQHLTYLQTDIKAVNL